MTDEPARPKTSVLIVHPADPCGSIPGGIDTFIRGEIDNAPQDIEYSVIGITTDGRARPVGQWTECSLSSNSFWFYAVSEHNVVAARPLIPVIVRFLANIGSVVESSNADVIEVHRFETLLRLRKEDRPLTAVLHQNMQSLYDAQADIRWVKLPAAYFWLEDKLAPLLKSAFCVRTDATEHYKQKFENLSSSCRFQPTWADPRHFYPSLGDDRDAERSIVADELGANPNNHWLITVGRLDSQKDPLLLLKAFQKCVAEGFADVELFMIGEGQLRSQLESFVREQELQSKVHLLGVKNVREVARFLRTADLFVLSSAYEGMPMAVIEAQASGVPVATTDVGEVKRVVSDRRSGRIAVSRSTQDMARAITWCLENLEKISGEPCLRSASSFSPAQVLEPVYENYRRLAAASTG